MVLGEDHKKVAPSENRIRKERCTASQRKVGYGQSRYIPKCPSRLLPTHCQESLPLPFLRLYGAQGGNAGLVQQEINFRIDAYAAQRVHFPRWESYVEFHRRFETRVSYNGSRELRMTRPHSGLNSRVKKQREYRDVTLTPPEEFDSNLERWTIQDIRTTVRYPDGSVSDPRSLSDRTDTPGCFSNSRLGLLILSRPLPSDTILRGVWLAGFTEDKPRAAYGLST